MFYLFKKLFKQSFIYGLGNASLHLGNFLLIPLYSKYLTPEEFGIQALLIVLKSILATVLDLGTRSSIQRTYFDYTAENDQKIFMGSAVSAIFIFSSLMMIPFLVYDRLFTHLLTDSYDYTPSYIYALLDIYLCCLFNLFLSYLRVKGRAYAYVLFSITKLLFILGLTIYFVAYRNEGLLGVFKGNAYASLIYFILIIPFFLKEIKLSFNIPMLKNILSFGLPFVPINIFSFILNSGDRYLLKEFATIQEVGLYAMGYRFAMVINIFVVQPFVLAWPQQITPISKKEDAEEIFGKTVTYFIGVSGYITICLLVFLDEIYYIATTPVYYASKPVVPIVAISYNFYGLYYILLIGIFLQKKTGYLLYIFAFASLLNVGLNLYFIPQWGMMGAAAATFIAYAVIPFMTYAISSRFYKIKFEYIRIIKMIMCLYMTYELSLLITTNNIYETIFLKILILMITPFLLYLSNFFEEKEKEKIIKIYSWGR